MEKRFLPYFECILSFSQSHNSNSCEHHTAAAENEDSVEKTDSKVMSYTYQQFGIPMVS